LPELFGAIQKIFSGRTYMTPLISREPVAVEYSVMEELGLKTTAELIRRATDIGLVSGHATPSAGLANPTKQPQASRREVNVAQKSLGTEHRRANLS